MNINIMVHKSFFPEYDLYESLKNTRDKAKKQLKEKTPKIIGCT